MRRKSKILVFQKIEVIEKYLRGEDSLNNLAKKLDISWTSAKQWLQTYLSIGSDGLLETSKNSVYTKDFKDTVVHDYLSSNVSLMDICKKYSIKSTSQIRNWILNYNSHEELKS